MKSSGNRQPLPSFLDWLDPGDQQSGDLTALGQSGVLDPVQFAQNLKELGARPGGRFWIENEQHLSRAIPFTPDPDLAIKTLNRLAGVSGIESFIKCPEEICELLIVLGTSSFLSDQLAHSPDLITWLFRESEAEKSSVEGVAEMTLPPADQTGGKESLSCALNLIKHRELVRMCARASLGYSSIEEEFTALSDLADRILDRVVELVWPEETPLVTIVALGKLGGRELNFSSDIDLIFALPLTHSPNLLSILPAATQAVERVLDVLTYYSPEGSLYRVDLRLRPGGDRAPLIRSMSWMESYYAGQGAPWERQMLVKSRICAGDKEGGATLLNILKPFIYPAHSDRDPGEEAHRLRRERRAREGDSLAVDHVKLAPGAIRDVEFIIQVIQLLYGGRRPEIRDPATLSGLEKLNRTGLIPDSEASDLRSAYLFFRRFEHYLQMQEERQTFILPASESQRRAIARLMGYDDEEEMLGTFNNHRERVLNSLNSLLPGIGEEAEGQPVESLLNLTPAGEEASRRLRERGFRKPEQTHRILLAAGSGIRASGMNAWASFVGLLPLLLESAVATGSPDRAINNLERILGRLGSPGAYASLLAREAPLRKALLTLCASGGLLTDLLLRHPEHFERLFSAGTAEASSGRRERCRRLRHLRHNAESSRALVKDLESMRTREFLASGLAYLMEEITLEEMMRNLGILARDLIRCFLGVHLDGFVTPPRAGVFSLGTLSAGYMTFSSDADLLFVHQEGSGADVQTLAARVAGLLSPPGGPYPVDMRLRPEGRSAPTSVDTEYLMTYLKERASPWEALALSRISPFYGRKSLLNRAENVIEAWLEDFHLDSDTMESLLKVRRSQEEEVSREFGSLREDEGAFDVKRSPGSLADIEYLVLALTLDRWDRSKPRSANIPNLIPPLVADGALSIEEGELLSRMYLKLRNIQVGLQLFYGRDVTLLPTGWAEGDHPLSMEEITATSIREEAARIRAIFDSTFTVSRR